VTAAAVGLVLVSAALHVTWNVLSKRVRPTPAFFFASLVASALLLSPVLAAFAPRLPGALARVWPALLATSFFSTVYNVALAASYRAGDLTLVYPLARSAAPLLVALASLALGRGDRIGWGLWAGALLVAAGSALLPLRGRRDLRLAVYAQPGFALPLVTAVATAGYTLVDDVGVRSVREAGALAALPSGLLYGALHAWATAAGLGVFVTASRRGRAELRALGIAGLRTAAWVGAASYAAYVLVLAALALAADVSYVAAFRQVGIPLSVAAGILFLGERPGALRLSGAALASAGLALVATR
jgi:drug/metabolite transporter (DMT)-like permease